MLTSFNIPHPQSPKSLNAYSDKENAENFNVFHASAAIIKPLEDEARYTERRSKAKRRKSRVSFSHTVDVRLFDKDEHCRPQMPPPSGEYNSMPACQRAPLKHEIDNATPTMDFTQTYGRILPSEPATGDYGDAMDITQTYGDILCGDNTPCCHAGVGSDFPQPERNTPSISDVMKEFEPEELASDKMNGGKSRQSKPSISNCISDSTTPCESSIPVFRITSLYVDDEVGSTTLNPQFSDTVGDLHSTAEQDSEFLENFCGAQESVLRDTTTERTGGQDTLQHRDPPVDADIEDGQDMTITRSFGKILSINYPLDNVQTASATPVLPGSADVIVQYSDEHECDVAEATQMDTTVYGSEDMAMTSAFGQIFPPCNNILIGGNIEISSKSYDNVTDNFTDMLLTRSYGGIISTKSSGSEGLDEMQEVTTMSDEGFVWSVCGATSNELEKVPAPAAYNATSDVEDMMVTHNYGLIIENSHTASNVVALKTPDTKMTFTEFLQRANVRFLDDFSTKTRRNSSIGYIRDREDTTGDIHRVEPSMKEQLEEVVTVKPQLEIFQWGCDKLGQITAQMHKGNRAAECALSDNPIVLSCALYDTKADLKALKSLCKQQAQKLLFEWRINTECAVASPLTKYLQLFQQDKGLMTKQLQQISKLRTQLYENKLDDNSSVPIPTIAKDNKCIQAVQVADLNTHCIHISNMALVEQIRDCYGLLKIYKDILMWYPRPKTNLEVLFCFQGGGLLRTVFEGNGDQIKAVLLAGSFSHIVPNFRTLLLGLAHKNNSSVKRTVELQHYVRNLSHHLCRVNQVLSEICYLSHRYNLRTSDIRQVFSADIPLVEFEFSFSNSVGCSKFLVVFEINKDYPFAALTTHTKVLFGKFSELDIIKVISGCVPGYRLLDKICYKLNSINVYATS